MRMKTERWTFKEQDKALKEWRRSKDQEEAKLRKSIKETERIMRQQNEQQREKGQTKITAR